MSYLEEILPEFRKGAKIRLAHWNKGKFIVLKEDAIVDNANYEYPLSIHETLSNQWELYQEPIDWDYIIKNKCPCWFWDDNFQDRALGLLASIDQANTKFPYGRDHNDWWCHCHPVKKDEVTFYEERKECEARK